jgi:hypothetical protein
MSLTADPIRPEPGCDEVEPLLPLVADGAIDAVADPVVFEHLARCQDCQDSLARHDLVGLSLERGRSGVPTAPSARRSWQYRLPMPVAAAAGLACAALGLWLVPQVASGGGAQVAQRAAPQVFSVPGPNPQRPYYAVVQDDHVVMIDPQAVDGAAGGERKPIHPVKLDVHPAADSDQ